MARPREIIAAIRPCYNMTMGGAAEKGKYVTVWKKQSDGVWKVSDDIFNADAAPQGPAAQHVMVAPSAITWGDAPPSLPRGAKMAVVSGDPTQAQPFVIRAQMPAGCKIAPRSSIRSSRAANSSTSRPSNI